MGLKLGLGQELGPRLDLLLIVGLLLVHSPWRTGRESAFGCQ